MLHVVIDDDEEKIELMDGSFKTTLELIELEIYCNNILNDIFELKYAKKNSWESKKALNNILINIQGFNNYTKLNRGINEPLNIIGED